MEESCRNVRPHCRQPYGSSGIDADPPFSSIIWDRWSVPGAFVAPHDVDCNMQLHTSAEIRIEKWMTQSSNLCRGLKYPHCSRTHLLTHTDGNAVFGIMLIQQYNTTTTTYVLLSKPINVRGSLVPRTCVTQYGVLDLNWLINKLHVQQQGKLDFSYLCQYQMISTSSICQ